ncbi:MAG: hypothetical protein FGM16_03475 [Flavobacterium sp.]|nr:hypothetical protein [Flavobacterium sp.]
MKKIYCLLSVILMATTSQAQNDSIYFWKNNVMIHKQSIKTADLDSITFRRPANPTGINIPGPNVTDIDGNTYESVTNCGLTFTKQNLNVSKYNDGTPIPQVTDPTQWANLTTGAWCYYENNTANGAVYGKLYNWYAVVGIYDAASAANPALRKKLAPTGWHVPTDAEWTLLTDCLGGYPIAGAKMKVPGTTLWSFPNFGASNESGFTGLPGGWRQNLNGFYSSLNFYGHFWSSTVYDLTSAWRRSLNYNNPDADWGNYNKNCGFSVRCLRD